MPKAASLYATSVMLIAIIAAALDPGRAAAESEGIYRKPEIPRYTPIATVPAETPVSIRVALPDTSAANPPTWVDTPPLRVDSATELTSRVLSLIHPARIGVGARIGVIAQDLTTGEHLVSINALQPMTPASCNKLFTTAAALDLLGADYTWETELQVTGEVRGAGVLYGDVLIRGTGDPTIGGRFNPSGDTKDLTWQFRDWARELRKQGIKRVQGDVIADDDAFDDRMVGTGWYPQERAEWYCAEVSAVSFNDACIDIEWKGDGTAGGPVTYRLNPPTKFPRINSLLKTVARNAGSPSIRYFREDKSNLIRVEGTVPAGRTVYGYAAIYNPSLFTATVLRETLISEGVEVDGSARDIDESTSKSLIRKDVRTVVENRSPALTEIVKVINLNSQNLYAELLLKTLGRERGREGSFEGGGEVVENWLRKKGIYRNGYVTLDGSGLSSLNRCAPRMLLDLLAEESRGPNAALFRESLPLAGSRGTLRARFQKTDEQRELAPKILGKTGLLGNVHSVAGYIDGVHPVAYVVILNDYDISGSAGLELVDSIVLEIARACQPKS